MHRTGLLRRLRLLAMTIWEVMQEVYSIRTFLLNEAITLSAMDLVQAYALSHGVQLANAMIAASALHHGETLLTANVKHFKFIPQLTVKKFIPGT